MSSLLLVLLFLTCTARAKVLLYPTGDVTACEGDTVTLTCVTDTGLLLWSLDRPGGTSTKFYTNMSSVCDSAIRLRGTEVFVRLISVSGSDLTSVATVVRAPLSHNGAFITCSDKTEGANIAKKVLLIQGPPSKPIELGFIALNFTSATLFWMHPTDSPNCVHNYTILLVEGSHMTNQVEKFINSSHGYTYNTTTTSTFLSVTGLSHGVEYTSTVTARNRAGRVGESETLLLSLKVPKRIVDLKLYLSWDSNEVILLAIWKQPASSHPPVKYYNITHNTTGDGNVSEVISHQTNITIHGAQLGSVYFIQVTPVNVLGPGPPTTTVLSSLDTPVNMSDPTATLQGQSCSCSVALGVSIPLCALFSLAGGCLVAVLMFVKLYKSSKKVYQLNSVSTSQQTTSMEPIMASNPYHKDREVVTEVHAYKNAKASAVRVLDHTYEAIIHT